MEFDQTDSQIAQFSLTDQFYDCFICKESHGLLVYDQLEESKSKTVTAKYIRFLILQN